MKSRFSVYLAMLAASVPTIVSTGCGTPSTTSYMDGGSRCSWELAIPPGRGRFPEACGEGHWPMAIVPLVGSANQLWMVSSEAVWVSTNGIRWTGRAKTDWGERAGMAYAFFDDRLWMLGGMKSWDDFRNDVWSSTNGTEWKQATPQAGWAARRNHAVAVFNNRLWVIGGAQGSGRANEVPNCFFNDVWASTDGVHWTQETSAAPWPARDGHVCLVFGEKLWLIGGVGRRDVWCTTDGQHWTQVTAKAEWRTRHSGAAALLDGRLWVFGGRGLNDVWCSTDGAHWRQAFTHAPWSPRTTVHSVVFDNKLWIYGGKTGRKDSWAGDVWTMTCAK